MIIFHVMFRHILIILNSKTNAERWRIRIENVFFCSSSKFNQGSCRFRNDNMLCLCWIKISPWSKILEIACMLWNGFFLFDPRTGKYIQIQTNMSNINIYFISFFYKLYLLFFLSKYRKTWTNFSFLNIILLLLLFHIYYLYGIYLCFYPKDFAQSIHLQWIPVIKRCSMIYFVLVKFFSINVVICYFIFLTCLGKLECSKYKILK